MRFRVSDLDTLKRSTLDRLVAREHSERARFEARLSEATQAAREGIATASCEGDVYRAVAAYTDSLAVLRGVPLSGVRRDG